jgi:hypothetical protein
MSDTQPLEVPQLAAAPIPKDESAAVVETRIHSLDELFAILEHVPTTPEQKDYVARCAEAFKVASNLVQRLINVANRIIINSDDPVTGDSLMLIALKNAIFEQAKKETDEFAAMFMTWQLCGKTRQPESPFGVFVSAIWDDVIKSKMQEEMPIVTMDEVNKRRSVETKNSAK